MKLSDIAAREEAVAIVREARDLARRGWIRKGRESTHHMVFDCLGRAAGACDRLIIPNAAEGHALAAVCKALGGAEPGSNRRRMEKIWRWQGTAGATQGNAIRILEASVEHARGGLAQAREQMGQSVLAAKRREAREGARALLRALAERARVHEDGDEDTWVTHTLETLGGGRGRRPLRRGARPAMRIACAAFVKQIVPGGQEAVHQRNVDALVRWERAFERTAAEVERHARAAVAEI